MEEPTVFIGGIAHETNSFAPGKTGRESFRTRRELFGDEVVTQLEGTNTEIGGVVEVAKSEDVELVPSVTTSAMPGPMVAADAFEFYRDRLLTDLRAAAGDIDGVLLSLHGAMVVEGKDDGEGPLVSSVREVVGEDVPIVVTLDLHGNITDELVSTADALVAYETYPHVDMSETGRRGTDVLLAAIRGEIDPVMSIERPPLSPVTPTQNTREGPMARVMERARELEGKTDVIKINVFPGFSRSDVPSMGFSISAVADNNSDAARDAVQDLAEHVWNVRGEFLGDFPEARTAVGKAVEVATDTEVEDGPVVLADVGDNPGGGGTADETPLLRELLDQGVTNAGFAILRDPDAVATCISAGVGKDVTLDLGAASAGATTEPIADVDCYIKAITDGQFRNYGPKATGTSNDLGRAVRLQCGPNDGIELLLTENRLQPADTEIWRHLGVQPERLDVLVVKSTNHYRADYEPRASRVIPVNTPGLAAMDPRQFDHQNLTRATYPIEDLSSDAYPDWET